MMAVPYLYALSEEVVCVHKVSCETYDAVLTSSPINLWVALRFSQRRLS